MKLNLFFAGYPLIQFAITIHFESQAIDGLHLSSPVLPFNDISFIKTYPSFLPSHARLKSRASNDFERKINH